MHRAIASQLPPVCMESMPWLSIHGASQVGLGQAMHVLLPVQVMNLWQLT